MKPPSRNLALRAARSSARHRRKAILGWLGLVVVAIFLGGAIGLNIIDDEDLGNGESRTAERILADAGFDERHAEQVLIQTRGATPTADDPAFRAAVADVRRALDGFDDVTDIQTPYTAANAGQISEDRLSALVTFEIRGTDDEAEDRVEPITDAIVEVQARHPALLVEEFGDASANKAISEAFEDDFRKAETLSLPLTLLILVVAFGALVAAGVPLLLGLSAVAIALGLLAPISQVVPVDEAISSVILLVGLAVGVDYSLFYLRRERDERRAGRSPEDALEAAAATSGRAVLISGCTVIIAMAGMFITGNSTFTSFGLGTILVVAVAIVGSLTVLPALLSKLGDRVDKGRIPFLQRLRSEDPEAGFWGRIVDTVLRRPLVWAVAATALLVVLAIPVFGMHTANSGVNGLPRDIEVMQTYDRIQAAFPGGPLPAIVAVRAENTRSPEVANAIRRMRAAAVETPEMQEPVTITYSPDRTVAEVSIPVSGNGTDDLSERAVNRLRDEVIPQTLGRVPGVEAPVTGLTASSMDFNDQMRDRAPWVFVFVLTLAFLLLMVSFRSIVIPLKAVILNLLSVGAAYGVLVWIFQEGHLESLLGFTSIGGITSWLPLFLFVILFGLSMDYHVFILARVREGHERGMSTSEAVSHGIKSTAGVVTSAAAVMVGVFAIFATLSSIDFKQMGVGLALAVLIDATIVRAVLLPATMKLLGDWNWYLPSWLEWLPRVAQAEDAYDPSAPFCVHERFEDGAVRLVVEGDLDLATAPKLRRCLEEVEEHEKAETIIVDLRETGFMDSSGMAVLVAANQRARRRGARFVVVRGPGTRVAAVLSAAALDDVLPATEEMKLPER
jgi:RND superfamily putative drug exporter